MTIEMLENKLGEWASKRCGCGWKLSATFAPADVKEYWDQDKPGYVVLLPSRDIYAPKGKPNVTVGKVVFADVDTDVLALAKKRARNAQRMRDWGFIVRTEENFDEFTGYICVYIISQPAK